MSKKNSLYVATKLENGVSDLVCMISKKKEKLEEIEGSHVREVITYKTREEAIEGLRSHLPYLLSDIPRAMYNGMIENGGFYKMYV